MTDRDAVRKENEVDDQFRTLLEGLRTTLPAVSVLFSFLLILPLQAPFGEIRQVERIVYYVAFVSAALATVLFVAPTAHQRVRAPISGIPRRSPRDVAAATWLTIIATFCFAVSIASVVYLVSALMFQNDLAAAVVTAVIVGVTAWSWFYMPLVTFSKDDHSEEDSGG